MPESSVSILETGG